MHQYLLDWMNFQHSTVHTCITVVYYQWFRPQYFQENSYQVINQLLFSSKTIPED